MSEVRETRTPEYGTEDYRRWSVLFNDVTRAPILNHLLLTDRLELTHHLWAQGWRRDVRPEDATRGEDVALGGVEPRRVYCEACDWGATGSSDEVTASANEHFRRTHHPNASAPIAEATS